MPLQATSGAASYDAFGGGAPIIPNYIEEVFSTWLYTGNGATQTITNGIDLSGKGGLVWVKSRSSGDNHALWDTARGAGTGAGTASNRALSANRTDAQGLASLPSANSDYLSAFTTSGFTVVDPGVANELANGGGQNYVAWTFREQPKFFDVVTYTGNGANRTIAHNLGSVPGCIIVKRTDAAADWQVYHTTMGQGAYMVLNSTAPWVQGNTNRWNNTSPTSTVFSLGTDATVNASGGTYVAYVFANNAGGFGASGTDNVISCAALGTDASGNATVNLGYEPQFVLMKNIAGVGGWIMLDSMRGWPNGSSDATLLANTSGAETLTAYGHPTATGFQLVGSGGAQQDYIYIAIRRGPMKVPTTGTSVFGLNARTGTGANVTVTGSAGVSDAVLIKNRGAAVGDLFASRLTGTGYMVTSSIAAEVAANPTILQDKPWDVMNGVKVGTTSTITNASSNTFVNYLFTRAPGFFDVVCYTGTGSDRTVPHNLGVAPELIIVKGRSDIVNWAVYDAPNGANNAMYFDANAASFAIGYGGWLSTTPTSSVFSVGSWQTVNSSGQTRVAYLFATCPGVSKVGSYTGTGTTQIINCGFTAGSRFVLIKRTDSTGDWYVWDSARGIVAGNDPYFLINSTAAEVTNTDFIDTASTGFEISSAAPAAINTSGGTYIFLAIA